MLRNRDDDIQNFKKREYELNLKLKEQAEMYQDNQNLRNILEAKTKEI